MNVLILLLIGFSASTLEINESIEGIWNTGVDNTTIEILQEDGEWLGKIKSTDAKKDAVGKVILKDLKSTDEKWSGKLFAAKRKQWFDVEIKPSEDKLNLLVDAGFKKKSIVWSRTENK